MESQVAGLLIISRLKIQQFLLHVTFQNVSLVTLYSELVLHRQKEIGFILFSANGRLGSGPI